MAVDTSANKRGIIEEARGNTRLALKSGDERTVVRGMDGLSAATRLSITGHRVSCRIS